jgi:hypothetical protein
MAQVYTDYVEFIRYAYIIRRNEMWPNGISEAERLDLEALGRKEAKVSQKVREDYYRQVYGQGSNNAKA